MRLLYRLAPACGSRAQRVIVIIAATVLALAAHAAEPLITPQASRAPHSQVRIETDLGAIDIELFDDQAPITVHNFLAYVNEKFYDGTIFHRAVANYVVQGGAYTPDQKEKAAGAPIKNESVNGLKNIRGAVAMARGALPDSAQAQFFINLADNIALDRINRSSQACGYCVFGRVVAGMDVVDKLATVEKKNNAKLYTASNAEVAATDVPKTPIVIKSIRVLDDGKP